MYFFLKITRMPLIFFSIFSSREDPELYDVVVCLWLQMESDVTVLSGRLKAVCEACTQTVPGLNGAAELHAELSAQLKLSWSVGCAVSFYAALSVGHAPHYALHSVRPSIRSGLVNHECKALESSCDAYRFSTTLANVTRGVISKFTGSR